MSEKPRNAPQVPEDLVERWKRTLLSKKALAGVIFVVAVVVGLAAFTEAIAALVKTWATVTAFITPAWPMLQPWLPAVLPLLIGALLLFTAVRGGLNAGWLTITTAKRRERAALAVGGIVLMAAGAISVWPGNAATSALPMVPPAANLLAPILQEYSDVIRKCVVDEKPAYIVESVTYLTRVEHVRSERREYHRHSYTVRALQDFDGMPGHSFYDEFPMYVARKPTWRPWSTGLIATERYAGRSSYPSSSYIEQVSLSMKRGERKTLMIGADAVVQLPLAQMDHYEEPIDDSPDQEEHSHTEYNNIPPRPGLTMDCVGEVTLIVESASLSLKAVNALSVDASKSTKARFPVRRQVPDGGKASVLAATWTDVVPGQRLLFYYTW